jgi:hypothetical protein
MKIAILSSGHLFSLSIPALHKYYQTKLGKKVYCYGLADSNTDEDNIIFERLSEDSKKDPQLTFAQDHGAYINYKVLETLEPLYDFNIDRTDDVLIKVLEELGPVAAASGCVIKIIDIPDDVHYHIISNEMGGEEVHEDHRIWL